MSETTPDPPGVYSYSDDIADLPTFDALVFNAFYWGINRDDGTSDNPLTLEQALEATANLNIEFNQYNIFFKFRGFDHINKEQFYTVKEEHLNIFRNYVSANNEVVDAFNIYVPYDFIGFGGYAKHNRKSLGVDSGHFTKRILKE